MTREYIIGKEEKKPSVVSATVGEVRKPKATLKLSQQGGFHGVLISAIREVLLLWLTCLALSSWGEGQGQSL